MSWRRTFSMFTDYLILRHRSFVGLGITIYLLQRYNRNFGKMEKEVTRHGYYDPRKAEAQIQLFKDIYLQQQEDERLL